MMNLLAGVFASMGMMFGGLFGGHHAPPADVNASTSPQENHMGSTTPWGNRGQGMMGSTTPSVFGKVTDITGTTLTVVGHSGMNSATTTYSVDASSAKFIKPGVKGVASSSPMTLSGVKVGDSVVVMGTVSGTSVVAQTVIDGVPPRSGMVMRKGTTMPMMQGSR